MLKSIKNFMGSVADKMGELEFVPDRRTPTRRAVYGNRSKSSTVVCEDAPAPAPTPSSKPQGQYILDHMLELAEHEIHNDPYRGLGMLARSMTEDADGDANMSADSPWQMCEWGTFDNAEHQSVDVSNPELLVRSMCQCSCPSITKWTAAAISQHEKDQAKLKRKKGSNQTKLNFQEKSDDEPLPPPPIGTRKSVQMKGNAKLKDYRCSCDFNPLCLGSLGGVVDSILEERALEVERIERKLESAKSKPADKTKNQISECEKKLVEDSDEVKSDTGSNHSSEKQSLTRKPPSGAENGGTEVSPHAIDVSDDEEKKSRDPPGHSSNRTKKRQDVDCSYFPPLKRRKLSPESQTFADYMKIFDPNSGPQISSADVDYSPMTKENTSSLRMSYQAKEETIRRYAYRTLGLKQVADADQEMTIGKFINCLKDWHQSLTFMNPIELMNDNGQMIETHILMSKPPGIVNLGATCYLNTHLQCLAQNPAFLRGIFSWRPTISGDRMASVISQLQKLLARMVVGGSRTVSTIDFSQELRLNTDEQQDPAEFARLLLDRISDSFRQCTSADTDLSDLLPSIFHGTVTYATECQVCKSVSKRSENFSDLSLPIVKKPASKPKSGIKSIFTSNDSKADTDLQFCLNEYTCDEEFAGENQYFCGACNAKQDAVRKLTFTKLPPVLNVQVNRYVYDMVKFTKKKLNDRVLLPLELKVQHTDPSTSKGKVSVKSYALCAVMMHRGTSAHHGHYVAEAMDWTTGQWFEFNDEIVTHLPNGPSSSFGPGSNDGCDVDLTACDEEGSKDAYNMYYVEASFLRRHAKSSVIRKEQLLRQSNNGSSVDASALTEVMKERDNSYKLTSEMCLTDCQRSTRAIRRRAGIRKFMFPEASSLSFENSIEPADGDDPVLVDGDFFRRYLDCKELMPELDGAAPLPILRSTELLCEHGLMHPQMARRGKLLPRRTYDAFISLLRAERAMSQHHHMDDNAEINDAEITLASGIMCRICSSNYCESMKQKSTMLRNLKWLYDLFATGNNWTSPIVGETEDTDDCVYVIAKQFISEFRKKYALLVKSVSSWDHIIDPKSTRPSEMSPAEGLDAIDVSAFRHLSGLKADPDAHIIENEKPAAKNSDKIEPVDFKVNTFITCPHGRCSVALTKTNAGLISSKDWCKLQVLFPSAIPHKIMKVSDQRAWEDAKVPSCDECYAQKLLADDERKALRAANNAKKNSSDVDAVVVLSDDEDDVGNVRWQDQTFKLKIFRVKRGTSFNETILTDLRVSNALPNNSGSVRSTPRRSTRARSFSLPRGGVTNSEGEANVGLHFNVAALRLNLFESCEISLARHDFLFVVQSPTSQYAEPVPVDLEKNHETLGDLLNGSIDRASDKGKIPFELETDLVLLYQLDEDFDVDSMEMLIEQSNLSAFNSEPTPTKRKSKQSEENGFSGTLLFGSPAPAGQKESDEGDSVIGKINTSGDVTGTDVEEKNHNDGNSSDRDHANEKMDTAGIIELDDEDEKKPPSANHVANAKTPERITCPKKPSMWNADKYAPMISPPVAPPKSSKNNSKAKKPNPVPAGSIPQVLTSIFESGGGSDDDDDRVLAPMPIRSSKPMGRPRISPTGPKAKPKQNHIEIIDEGEKEPPIVRGESKKSAPEPILAASAAEIPENESVRRSSKRTRVTRQPEPADIVSVVDDASSTSGIIPAKNGRKKRNQSTKSKQGKAKRGKTKYVPVDDEIVEVIQSEGSTDGDNGNGTIDHDYVLDIASEAAQRLDIKPDDPKLQQAVIWVVEKYPGMVGIPELIRQTGCRYADLLSK